MKCINSSAALALLLTASTSAFTFVSNTPSSPVSLQSRNENANVGRLSPLFMGRAAAVRAATKSKTDAKKAKINAVYGKKIIMAVKSGGSADPNANRQLADLIKQAKANSVPVDNINRAIKKASEANTGDFAESTFEAYGLGGASFIINVLSDNSNRCTADVRSTVNKRNGKIAEQGSVLFMYDKKGVIEVPAVIDEEDLMMAAIDAGCDEMELMEGEEEGTSIIFTDPKETGAMMEAVKSLGFETDVKMSLRYITKAPVECTEEDFEKNMEIIDALEDLDDVDSVEHNMSN
uniref:Transcriptional regulatory protein n=1 Tax=Ditylum brightwellii TaxID=49249 RepID=A0A6V2AAN3_9STRA|mmetsp:Transcript_26642/g.38601  ORF Transcript_26642/g.38601 Transcript_26642/m.38601 type:complete len:292 (+) Transcript_26642:64-939(+)